MTDLSTQSYLAFLAESDVIFPGKKHAQFFWADYPV